MIDQQKRNSPVLFEIKRNSAIITLNRPEKHNPLNNELIDYLLKYLDDAEDIQKIHSVILTGQGDASFCSGADLTQAKLGISGEYEYHLKTYYHPVLHKIMSMEKPVIASINGMTAGAGVGLALACDYIIMSEAAQFYIAFSKIGLIPDTGVMTFLARRLGKYKAFELAVLAKEINAEDAVRHGLANEMVKVEKLMDRTLNVAQEFSKMPLITTGLIKRFINRVEELSLNEALEMECKLQEIAGGTEDHMEGITAFLEKRKPEFKGH